MKNILVVKLSAIGDVIHALPVSYALKEAFPDVELVPVWITNLRRVMPKGALVPVPLLSTVTFGAPLERKEGTPKAEYLQYAASELLKLKEVQQ